MARRRTSIIKDETLSQETPEVQEKVLDELLEEPKKDVENKEINISNKKQKDNVVEPRDNVFNINDKVKINSNIENDIMGRRIHNGLKNYTYRVLSVRIDGMLIVECLTHCFTLRPEDVHKV